MPSTSDSDESEYSEAGELWNEEDEASPPLVSSAPIEQTAASSTATNQAADMTAAAAAMTTAATKSTVAAKTNAAAAAAVKTNAAATAAAPSALAVDAVIRGESFKFLSPDQVDLLVSLIDPIIYSDKQPIPHASSILFVLAGEVSVHDREGKSSIAALTSGDMHGHIELLLAGTKGAGSTRLFSSRDRTVCATLSQDEIRAHLPLLPGLLVLNGCPWLLDLPYDDRAYIAGGLFPHVYEKGQYLVHQGAPVNGLSMIIRGSCTVTQKIKRRPGDASKKVVTELYTGHFFGEMSLVAEAAGTANANASVLAHTDIVATCIFPANKSKTLLSRSAEFREALMKEIQRKEHIQNRRRTSSQVDSVGIGLVRSASMQRVTEYQKRKSTKRVRHSTRVVRSREKQDAETITAEEGEAVSSATKGKRASKKTVTIINGYAVLQTLGKGSFGKVKLVEKGDEYFAMKIISRSILKRLHRQVPGQSESDHEEQVNAMMMEVALMKRMHHVNVIGLEEVLDDPSHEQLYIISEYCAGGEVMQKAQISPSTQSNIDGSMGLIGQPLPRALAHKYTRDLVRGIAYCHSQGIVHRDIKPENLCTCWAVGGHL